MECVHHTPSSRFDPGLCAGYCPSCGQTVGAETGQPVASHQKPDGSRETCPGSGQTAQ